MLNAGGVRDWWVFWRRRGKIAPFFQERLLRGSVVHIAYFGGLKCCFTSTETIALLGTGAQDVHLDFHTAPEL